MNIIEHVARSILVGRHPMTRPEDIWLDPAALADARAALIAGLTFARDNPSKAMLSAGAKGSGEDSVDVAMGAFEDMLSQLLAEIEGE